MLSGCCGDLSYDVTLPVFPRAAFDSILGLIRWPKTKSVVVFCNHHNVPNPGGLDSRHPLPSVELRWIKSRGAGRSVSPFLAKKCVRSEVNEDAEIELLPLQSMVCWFQFRE